MDTTIAPPSATRHRELPEKTSGQLKADLRKADGGVPQGRDWKREIGQCLHRARKSIGWSLKELAAALPPPPRKDERDPRQVQRWEKGAERTPVEIVYEVDALREPFAIEVARLGGADVLLVFRKAG